MALDQIILSLIFGILPSLIWLGYYVRKDLHPEPKRMIARVFTGGALATVPTLFFQLGLLAISHWQPFSSFFQLHPLTLQIITWFFIIAFSEEFAKYWVVRTSVLKSGEIDEPLDLMLYMVVASLGFAATENILYLFSPSDILPLSSLLEKTLLIALIRFIGATFLHTLCSALVGYFLVRKALRPNRKTAFVFLGIALATLLHGLYDFSIMTMSSPASIIVPAVIIFILAIFVMYDFDAVKKWRGICKL